MLQMACRWCCVIAGAVIHAAPVAAQQETNQPVSAIYRYADVADLALASSVVAHVKVKKSKRLGGKISQGVALDRIRYFVTADVIALIKAPGTQAKRLTYLIDLPSDSQARLLTPLKGEAIIFGTPGRPGEVRLVAPDAQITQSPELATMVRSILAEAAKPEAAPKVIGIANAFHAPGNLIGEGETQIFLETENGLPVSLNIRRRTGEQPRWFAAAGETVDESSAPPRRNTLLWYRLACTLPHALPPAITADLDTALSEATRADYSLVVQSLGKCQRARTPVG